MKGKFHTRPGGKLVRVKNRFGGNDAEHCRYSMLCRRESLETVLQHDFDEQVRLAAEEPVKEEPVSTWTILEPMSGKFRKTIFVIEADEDLAIRIYAARNGGRHPLKVSCDCGCGSDYMLTELTGTLAQATASARNCPYGLSRSGEVYYREGRRKPNPEPMFDYQTLDQFLARKDVVLIREADMTVADFCEPTPRLTGPHQYTPGELALAWVLDAEL